MNRRKAILLSLLALTPFVTAVLLHPVLLKRRPQCDRAAYETVRVGMTLKEVSRAIGAPPGDYRGEPVSVDLDTSDFQLHEGRVWDARLELLPAVWQGPKGRLVVWFDDSGRAAGKEFLALRAAPRCWLLRLLRVLREAE